MSATPLRETRFDPLVAGHAVFRRLLEATANPGAVVRLDNVDLVVQPARLAGACALLLAVLDDDVGLRVAGPQADAIAEYLRFNSGARSASLEHADFVLNTGATSDGQLSRLMRNRSRSGAILVYAPATLSAQPRPGSVALALAGPTVSVIRRLSLTGIDADELDRLHALSHSPLGVDLWLASASGALVVIPRSTLWIREA